MKFCPKCGIMLALKNGKLVCSKCGHKEAGEAIKGKEIMYKGPKVGEGALEPKEGLPTIEMKCKKCDNMKCFFWTQQTRAGDEAETSFFKCMKCDYTWREYR